MPAEIQNKENTEKSSDASTENVSDKPNTSPSSATEGAIPASKPTPTAADIKSGQKDVTPDELAKNEAIKDYLAAESRIQRINSDLMEQKKEHINIFFSFLGLIILAFYVVFLITVVCLFIMGDPFHKDFSVTGVVLIGMTGSIPTFLSIFLMTGLFSNKDQGKEKDEKPTSASDLAGVAKLLAEVLKYIRHH